MPHNPLGPVCTAATIHLAAAVPNFSWLEYLPDRHGSESPDIALYSNPFVIKDTAFPVLDSPGLGIDVDEAALTKLPFQIPETHHLRRPDGSLTNW